MEKTKKSSEKKHVEDIETFLRKKKTTGEKHFFNCPRIANYPLLINCTYLIHSSMNHFKTNVYLSERKKAFYKSTEFSETRRFFKIILPYGSNISKVLFPALFLRDQTVWR